MLIMILKILIYIFKSVCPKNFVDNLQAENCVVAIVSIFVNF